MLNTFVLDKMWQTGVIRAYPPVPHTFSTNIGNGLGIDSNTIIAM